MFGIDQQVQQTADAYRGKPQMLQQKYAQNQQLIDLLALQKLKSDKEEASRQMALQMGGQGKPPTIADQRESQVLDMTKKEVVEQQAGVMQNRMQQQQAAQQKLLQSAGAPQMPAQGMPPQQPQQRPQQPPAAGLAGLPAPNLQGMAGGGIVAFSGNTGDGSYVDPLAEATGMSSEDLARDKERAERIRAEREAEKDAVLQAFLRRSAPQLARQEPAAPQSQTTAPPQAEQPPAPAPRAAPQGMGGGAPMGNAPGTVGFGIQSLIGSKTPEEAARENEARAAAAANFTPEERAGKQRIIDERSAAYDRSKFARALMAMYGQTSNYGAIAAGGAQAENDASQAMAARQQGENELINIGPASRMAGTKAGESRYKDVIAGMSQGVDAAVKQAQIASSAADRQLAREGLNANNAQNRYTGIQAQITRESARLDRIHKDSVAELSIRGLKPNEYKIALAEINAVRDLGYQQVQNTFAPVMQKLESGMGISSANGFSLVSVRPNTPPK
jgi:hypothetical protein